MNDTIKLTEREREEIIFAGGGGYTIVENNRIGAGLARKGLAVRADPYYCPLEGRAIIEYYLTDEGVLLRDKLWAADGHVYNPATETVTYNRNARLYSEAPQL